ncbi:MAG: hypothetical protein JXB35_02750 [Anaerolineae bacterium]|nr:hypothetical protein [Anaerolineae bacterium]
MSELPHDPAVIPETSDSSYTDPALAHEDADWLAVQEEQSISEPESLDEVSPVSGGAASINQAADSAAAAVPVQQLPPATSAPVASAPAGDRSLEAPPVARVLPPTWAILLIVLGLLIIVGAAVGALMTNRKPTSTGGAESLEVDKLSTFDSPPVIPEGLAVLQENGNPLPATVPSDINIHGRLFPVIPVAMENGRWPVPAENGERAVWIYGTVVNYVVGLPYTATTQSLLAALDSTAKITLTLNNGTALVFGSLQAQRFPVEETTMLSQQRPGLTLVLLGGQEADRLVIQARYLPEESPVTGGPQALTGLEVEVVESGIVASQGATRSYIVEYSLTNAGVENVDPAQFDMILEDGLGQRYPLSAEASALGQQGLLTAPVQPGATVAGSAGYQVPSDLTPPLTWLFRPDPAGSEFGRFSLPYQPPLPAPAQPAVELTGAFSDGQRGVIVINGLIRNTGESTLRVGVENIVMTSGAGSAELRAVTPTLPWEIAGGGEQPFEAQFGRPSGVNSVLLDIMGFTFQIEGLP